MLERKEVRITWKTKAELREKSQNRKEKVVITRKKFELREKSCEGEGKSQNCQKKSGYCQTNVRIAREKNVEL